MNIDELLSGKTGAMLLLCLKSYYTPLYGSKMVSLAINAIWRTIPYGDPIYDSATKFRNYILSFSDYDLDQIRSIGKVGKEIVHTMQDDLQDPEIISEMVKPFEKF